MSDDKLGKKFRELMKKKMKEIQAEEAAKVNPKVAKKLASVVTTKPADDANVGGLFTIVALLGILGYIVHRANGFSIFWDDFPKFFTGEALSFTHGNLFATSVTTILVEVLLSFAVLIVMGILGQTKTKGEHAVGNMMSNMQVSHHFFGMLFMVVVEELFARWLFLGLFRMVPFLQGTLAFYALFLLGNGLWSLIHLFNFEDEEDRKLIKVLPQFVSGILFTYIYMKYGLLMSVVVHMGCNAVLFSLHKVERFGVTDTIMLIYTAAVALIAYENMGVSLSDMLVWIDNPNPGGRPEPLAGWGFWNYFAASLALSYGVQTVAKLMLFDGDGEKKEEKKDNNLPEDPIVLCFFILAMVALVLALFLGLVNLTYWMTGWFYDDFFHRAMFVSLLAACLNTGRSGSSISKVFWVTVPLTYSSVCIILVLGFWSSAASIGLCFLIGVPVYVINKIKNKIAEG